MLNNILGPHSGDDWWYSIILYFLGFLLFKLIKFNSNSSTGKFSFSYWFKDNYKELFAGLIVFYISFRFHNLVSVEFSKFWDTVLVTNKFLFTVIIGTSMTLILEKLRVKLNLKNN